MAVQGLVRLRKHQIGRQQTHGTVVAATRAYPFKGVPANDLGWTDQDIDAGSLDVTAAPFRGPSDLTLPATDPALAYNDIPIILSGFFGGNVDGAPSGTTEVWDFAPASEAPLDTFDYYTYEFGDDVLDDWFQLGNGIVESFDVTGPDGLGALTASINWRFGSFASTGSTDSGASGTVPTPSLNVDTNPTLVYLKDCAIAIASDVYSLDTGQITNALHTFTLRGSGDIGSKRWANGDQSFDVDEFVRETRALEIECTFAKTSDTVGTGSESDAWMADQAVTRYCRLTFTSTVEADTAVPYSWVVTMPIRYYTRTEGEIGGNTVVVLTGHAFFDPDDLAGVFTSTVVNTLSAADLGSPGS